jgi:hypothetical protein
MFANVSELNRIIALWNGQARGAPTFDSETGAFLWDLQDEVVKEGDTICVGAVSVTGHVNLYVLQFAAVTEGMLLGLTTTTDTQECGELP